MTKPTISTILPNSGPLARRLGIVTMAQTLVDAGSAGLWVNDHLVLQDDPITNYPYSDDGRITWNAADDYFEPLNTCAYVAGAVHGEFTVGTAVLILPQRNVLQTAKELATIDQLTGGRLRVGVGAGWNTAEMEALGYAFDTRGERFDEMLTIFRDAWSGRTTAFTGAHVAVAEGLWMQPPPTKPAGPPLIVGGMSGRALRRAGTIGDGWMALAYVHKWDPESLDTSIRRYRSIADDRGRAPFAMLKLHCPDSDSVDMAGRIADAAEIGFNEVAVEVPWAHGLSAVTELVRDIASTNLGTKGMAM